MNNALELKNKLYKLKNSYWIKCDNNHSNNVGVTIERLLGVENNNLEYPDYEGIELKTIKMRLNRYFTLFNASPDNTFFEIKRIQKEFGYSDKDHKEYKVFNTSIFRNQITSHPKHNFQLFIDDFCKCIRLIVFDKFGNVIDSKISWSYSLLKTKFVRKFKNFCLICVDTKKVKNETYFKIRDFSIYKALDFKNFIQLVEKDKIRVTFKIGVFKSGKRIGQIHDRGTGFDLFTDSLDELFLKYK